MRLRRKPWIDEAIHEYDSHIILSGQEQYKGKWRELFAHPERPLYMELGTGKGRFIAGMAEEHPEAAHRIPPAFAAANATDDVRRLPRASRSLAPTAAAWPPRSPDRSPQ